jgi:hypothetical protein
MGTVHGVPQIPVWIWLTAAGVFIGIPAGVICLALLLRARASRSAYRLAGTAAGAERAHVRRVTACGLAGLGAGALLGVAMLLDNRAGLGVLTCAGGYLIGLLLGEYTGQPPVRGTLRTARLLARRPTDYVPRWAVATAVLSAVLVVAAPIAFALAPSVTYGRWHPAPGVNVTLPGGQTSWPALFPGTAAAGVLAILVLLVGAAGLRRVAFRPGLAGAVAARPDQAADVELQDGPEELAGPREAVDDVLRRQAGHAMLGAVLGLELITLAAILIAGSGGLAVPVSAVAPAAYLGNRIMVIAGVGCAFAGPAAWLVLSGWTRRRPLAMPPDGPVPTHGP